MAVIKSGAGTDTLTVDPTSKAARTTLYDAAGNPLSSSPTGLRTSRRPLDFGALGIYRFGQSTTTIGAGLGGTSELLQFRWTDASRLAAIFQVYVSAGLNVAATAAALAEFNLIIARAWTVAGTGGVVATVSGNNLKLRASMGSSLVGEIRMSNGGSLTAGTKTLDAHAIGNVSYAIGTGILTTSPSMTLLPKTLLFDADDNDNMPIILAQNEGVVVRTGPAAPATMTWHAGIGIVWAELTAY